MDKPKISIIIPTKNEEEGIAKVICSIPEDIIKISEVIVVDNSDDLTPIIAKKLGAKVIRTRKKGKGYAMKLGVKYAKGEILVFLDGDATDPPQYISKLLKKLEKCDIVLGARTLGVKGSDKKTETIFRIYIPVLLLFFSLLGFKTRGDPLAGFRAMRKETWNKLNLKSNDFLIETEMNLRAVELGLKVCEVPIPILPRAGGLLKSKLVSNPRDWMKIFSYGIKHAKDKKLKIKIEKLKKKVYNLLKNLKYEKF